MHALPKIDLTKEVSMSGYRAFEKDGRKNPAGLTIEQGGVKLKSFFSWKEGEEWKNLEGFPLPDKKTKERGGDLWKMYFDNVRVWMIDYLETNGYIQPPQVAGATSEETADKDF